LLLLCILFQIILSCHFYKSLFLLDKKDSIRNVVFLKNFKTTTFTIEPIIYDTTLDFVGRDKKTQAPGPLNTIFMLNYVKLTRSIVATMIKCHCK